VTIHDSRFTIRDCRATWLLTVWLIAADPLGLAAADYFGQVTFSGLPVPGATVTAALGDPSTALGAGRTVRATTNEDGIYHLADLADGVWMLTIEMLGFAKVEREITVPADQESVPETLTARALDELARAEALVQSTSAQTFPRTPLKSFGMPAVAGIGTPVRSQPLVDLATLLGPNDMGAAEGMLINGSLNNGASTPFALPRGIGNNRPRLPSVRTYAFGIQLGNSAWDAAPFSLSGSRSVKPNYTDTQVLGTLEGQFRLPLLRNPITLTVGYQGSSATTANVQFARVPTDLERAGDFSQTLDAAGQPVRIVDPSTDQPFSGSAIDRQRISPQALALLNYYPHADAAGSGQFNYQAPLLTGTRQDSIRSQVAYRVNTRHQITGGGSYQRTAADTTTLFRFQDDRDVSAFSGQGSWRWNPERTTNIAVRYDYARTATQIVPFFSNRVNVSENAGITGNDQDPRNWGPPSLTFASDIAGLRDGIYSSNTDQTHAIAAELTKTRGAHTVSVGGEFRIRRSDVFGQQDPRGSFGFTGAATGLDFADFLIGLPQTSAIGYGNPDKYFRGGTAAAYAMDDWRVRPSLTLTYGVRWEYESPVTEAQGRLVNLDVAPGFIAVSEVAAGTAGPLTGRQYSDALVRRDARGFEPRLAFAWRPRLGSSLAIRGSYGIYRSTNVYQPIASLLAVQPPLATTFNIASSASHPLTLADGFTPADDATLTTFAVDPDFRVATAHTWDASIQRDLPGAMTVLATYLGTKGTHLMQMFLPNTYPPGAENPCVGCPAGFRYLTSGGRSVRHAGSIQLRRRLSGGFTSSVQYTLAKSMDNAAAFGGATLEGGALMQNWLDPEAEYARSNFDQRHLVNASVEHTTGVGMGGGTLVDGWKGRLLKDWTFTATFSAGSGLPLTPVYFAPVGGTGIVGSIRPDATGVANTPAAGSYANPAAFAVSAPGQWGSAARNSITGPSTFTLNAGVTRTFRVNSRLNLDWRLDASNVLNRVTYASVNTLVTSPQFGLPNRANDMRKLRTSIRVRF
jgi:trimeric autotransporter adhesin